MTEKEQLEAAIAAQESLRATLGDAVVDVSISALRAKLASLAPAAAEQRRLVTILFADVSGFTAMSETMDAEEVRDTMNALWEKLDAAIVKHGGAVDKHIGDALMALFGAQTAREEDPERAVRAALLLQDELRAFAEKSGRALRMRIGVNTGPALLGIVGSNAEFTAMGDAVNLASRLEHAAPVGGVLISHETYMHVRGLFDVEPQEPLQVKGKQEPVRTYVVMRAKPLASRVGERGLDIKTRMVGRDGDLQAVLEDLSAATKDGRTRLTMILGDAGMGKSRLLREFTTRTKELPEPPTSLIGRASAESAESAYGLLKDVFSRRFEIDDSDASHDVRAKFETGAVSMLGGGPDAQAQAHYAGHLIGFDFSSSPHVAALSSNPSLVRERGVGAVHDLLRAAAARAPHLLLLEDIHWADDATLDFVERLPAAVPDLRLHVVALARPSLFERRPNWREDASTRRVELAALSKADCRAFVEDILSRVDALPESLRDKVVESSDGNPFYIEELIRMLMEDGVIVRAGESWRVDAQRLPEAKVPSTLAGVLQARLDGLSSSEKAALQCASVIGRIFWDSALAALSASRGGLEAAMDALRSKGMIFRRERSTFAGADEHIFKHALLRDAAYESVLKKSRRSLHAAAAAWLAARCGERAGEFASQLARHYELAGDNEAAADQLRKAADDAIRRGNAAESAKMIRRALALEPERASARRGTLLREAARIFGTADEQDTAIECADASVRVFEELGDRLGLAGALNEACIVSRKRGDFPGQARRAERFRALAVELGDPEVEGDSLAQSAWASVAVEDYETAKQLYERSLAVRAKLGSAAGIAACRIMLGSICNRLGDYAAAKGHYEASIEHYRTAGDRIYEMIAVANLGQVCAFLGERDKARMLLETAALFQRAHGIKAHLANSLDSLAELAELDGDRAGARRLFLEAGCVALEARSNIMVLNVLAGYARLLAREGRGADALASYACAATHPSSSGEARQRAAVARAPIEAALGARTVEEALKAGPPSDLLAFAGGILRAG